jgi:hypothetical protein
VKEFQQFLIEDMRLVMLRLLAEMPQYRSNSSILVTGLDSFGHSFSRDQVKTQLRWLADNGHITVETETDGGVLVVKLTESGADVASGRIKAHGIKRPGA